MHSETEVEFETFPHIQYSKGKIAQQIQEENAPSLIIQKGHIKPPEKNELLRTYADNFSVCKRAIEII